MKIPLIQIGRTTCAGDSRFPLKTFQVWCLEKTLQEPIEALSAPGRANRIGGCWAPNRVWAFTQHRKRFQLRGHPRKWYILKRSGGVLPLECAFGCSDAGAFQIPRRCAPWNAQPFSFPVVESRDPRCGRPVRNSVAAGTTGMREGEKHRGPVLFRYFDFGAKGFVRARRHGGGPIELLSVKRLRANRAIRFVRSKRCACVEDYLERVSQEAKPETSGKLGFPEPIGDVGVVEC